MDLLKGWADIVNRAYEQNNCPERVSHLSLEAQGEDRKSKKYLPPAELWKQRKQVRPCCHTPEQELIKEKKIRPVISLPTQREDPDKFPLSASGKRRRISDSGTE